MIYKHIYYVYQLRVEDKDLPFYVGKGFGSRAYVHLDGKSGFNRHKNHTILKAIRENKKVLVEFLELNQSDSNALIFETFYVSAYGRRDLGLGPLTNLTNGGEGMSGYLTSDESKLKMSEGQILSYINNPLRRIHMSNVTKARFDSQEAKIAHSKLMKQVYIDNPELNERLSTIQKINQNKPETRKKKSESLTGIKRTDEFKVKLRELKLEYHKSDINRQANSDIQKAVHSTQEVKDKKRLGWWRRDIQFWTRAQELYEYYLNNNKYTAKDLIRDLNITSSEDRVRSIKSRFSEGWVPNEDHLWLKLINGM